MDPCVLLEQHLQQHRLPRSGAAGRRWLPPGVTDASAEAMCLDGRRPWYAEQQVCNFAAAFPMRASPRYIVDSKGSRLRLKCASWSGGQEKWYVPSGLWAQHRNVIASMAKAAGLNCIRLVWSVESVLNPAAKPPAEALSANPDLVGKTPMQVLDAVVAALAKQGLLVILDNHTSDAIWCCNLNDGNGLWYTERWSEQQWLTAWRIMATRYAKVPAVVGVGLRNEPRPAVVRGILRLPTWGSNDPGSDLALAYEKAAAAVLGARPTYLIFAQGNLAGRDLVDAQTRPIRLQLPNGTAVANQLVYEVHEYPWYWMGFDFDRWDAYARSLDTAWGYLVRKNMAPVWVGEFGTTHDAAGVTSPWFQAFLRYIRELDLDWSYWPLDGQQGPSRTKGAEETYGLLNTTWNGFAYPPLVQQLALLSVPYNKSSSSSRSSRRVAAGRHLHGRDFPEP